MTDITLYKFTRDDGGVTVSPDKPQGEYTTLHRLIADEGMTLQKGDVKACCIDTDSADGWNETEAEADEIMLFDEGATS